MSEKKKNGKDGKNGYSFFPRFPFHKSRPRAEVHSPLPEREAQKDPQAR